MRAPYVPRPIVLVLLVLLALAPAPFLRVAQAGQPTRLPYPLVDTTVPDVYCGFEIDIKFTGAREYIKTYELNGKPLVQKMNGTDKAILTNLDTAKSLAINVSGPATYTFYPDGSLTVEAFGRGAYPWALGTAAPLPGYPVFFIGTGRAFARYDAAGNIVEFEGPARVEDLCAALSD